MVNSNEINEIKRMSTETCDGWEQGYLKETLMLKTTQKIYNSDK